MTLQEDDCKTLKAHILWLGTELEKSRVQCRDKTELLKRMLDPEDLGHAVSNEVRSSIYQILIEDSHNERDAWNR